MDAMTKLKLEKALKKDINREGIKEEREKKRLEESRVKIKTAQRQGKKQVTLVSGLHHFSKKSV